MAKIGLFSGLVLVSMLSCGQGNYLCLEVCWEAGSLYGDGAVTSKPGSAVRVQGQIEGALASPKGAARVGSSLFPFLRGTTQASLSACTVNVVCTVRGLWKFICWHMLVMQKEILYILGQPDHYCMMQEFYLLLKRRV